MLGQEHSDPSLGSNPDPLIQSPACLPLSHNLYFLVYIFLFLHQLFCQCSVTKLIVMYSVFVCFLGWVLVTTQHLLFMKVRASFYYKTYLTVNTQAYARLLRYHHSRLRWNMCKPINKLLGWRNGSGQSELRGQFSLLLSISPPPPPALNQQIGWVSLIRQPCKDGTSEILL